MTYNEITEKLQFLTARERKITAEILELIHIADRDRIYRAQGYSSTFEWLVKVLKFSEATAYRRISASRLVEEIPDLGEKLGNGDLKLSQVVQVQIASRKVEKRTGIAVPSWEKAALFRKIEGKSKENPWKQPNESSSKSFRNFGLRKTPCAA